LRSTGYAPSKTQKLTKNQPVFANGRDPEQALRHQQTPGGLEKVPEAFVVFVLCRQNQSIRSPLAGYAL
jgi:hypothetical protein